MSTASLALSSAAALLVVLLAAAVRALSAKVAELGERVSRLEGRSDSVRSGERGTGR